MKNKKLKRTSIANLIGGYLLAIMFVVLMMVGIKKPEIVVDDTIVVVDEPVVETNTTIVKQEVVYDSLPRVDYVDRLNGIIIDDPDNVYTAVVNGDDRINTIDVPDVYSRGVDRDVDRDIVVDGVGVSETGVNHVGGNRGVVDRGIHGNRVDGNRDDVITFEDATRGDHIVDRGLLDRRLNELHEQDKIGLDTKDGLDVGNLSPVTRQDDQELGSVSDFDESVSADGGYGVGKGGQLYAYNFPSQGVGAGVGSGTIGAGAAASAGLSAGVGQAVLNGESVPTLGGVGTYNSVQTIPPGTGTDKDKDGLSVEAELALGTDPTKADSDGDGYTDGAEIESYTDPTNASSNPSVAGSSGIPAMGGVGGLTGGAGAGGAAGLMIGQVTLPTGMGVGPGTGIGTGAGYGRGGYDYDHLPKNGALHIMMHVDGSGSILRTRKQLEIMKDTLLKEALLPYYDNDESLYNRRVTIVDGSGERTLKFFTQAAQKDNVLAVVFQDEAQPAYHLPNFNKKPEDHYSDDLGKLKASLNGYKGLYRGVMFQVGDKVFSKAFKEFVENAWRGEGYLKNDNLSKYYWQENNNNIRNKSGVVFSDEYHVNPTGDPQYYLNAIFAAAKKIGLDLNIQAAGLTDGKKVNK